MKYIQYLKERFPPQQFVLLAGLLAAVLGAFLQTQAYGRVASWPAMLLAALALLLFLFRLRLFDELKDYAHDRQFYPERPLQRGLVTTADIKRLIFISLALETGVAVYSGAVPLAWFAASLVYSLLMFKEFFAPAWLRRRFTLYIFLHELLAIPLFFYAASLQLPGGSLHADPLAWTVVLFLGFQLFFLEIARKMRPPDLENAARDTYTAQYGLRGASSLLIVAAAIAFALGLSACGWDKRYLAALPVLVYFGYCVKVFSSRPDLGSSKTVFNAAVAYFTLLNAAAIWAALA